MCQTGASLLGWRGVTWSGCAVRLVDDDDDVGVLVVRDDVAGGDQTDPWRSESRVGRAPPRLGGVVAVRGVVDDADAAGGRRVRWLNAAAGGHGGGDGVRGARAYRRLDHCHNCVTKRGGGVTHVMHTLETMNARPREDRGIVPMGAIAEWQHMRDH